MATSSPSTRRTTLTKLDAPSGTALTLKEIILSVRPGIEFRLSRIAWAMPRASTCVRAVSDYDTLELRHDAHSRRGFALGAVRGAEWLAGKTGAWEFREIFALGLPTSGERGSQKVGVDIANSPAHQAMPLDKKEDFTVSRHRDLRKLLQIA
jgi:hypothetical protein